MQQRQRPEPVQVRLRLVEGRSATVAVERCAPGDPAEFAVRDRAGLRLPAGPDELAEAIECATGVHAARAQRLAEVARRRLG